MTSAETTAWLDQHTARLPPEPVPLKDAAGRVLAAPQRCPAWPPQPVAAIDGHAVRASETEGASDYAAMPIGGAPIIAGAPLPPGTDAVLPPMAVDHGPVAIAPVARGSDVHPAGHDIPDGWTLPAGTVLGPLHLLLLARLGHATAEIVRCPHVAMPRQSPMLHALIAATGAIVADPPDLILGADATSLCNGIPALHLPGLPLEAFAIFTLVVAPTLRRMGGRPALPSTPATLARKIASPLGQEDAVFVTLDAGRATPLGPASTMGLVASLAANGLVLVPGSAEGYPEGATVQVHPLCCTPC